MKKVLITVIVFLCFVSKVGAVNNNEKLPSFANEELYYTINSNYEIVDDNNVLSDFKILESNISATIKDNKLIIKTNKKGIYNIKFIKTDDITFNLTINVEEGNIFLYKEDIEFTKKTFATLEGARYGLYKDNVLIKTVITDIFGKAQILGIPLANYTVKEISPSKGYTLDKKVYVLNLNHEYQNMSVVSNSTVIRGNLILNKYYKTDTDYQKEKGAEFVIYDINDKFIGKYETINGQIKVRLDYGTYKVIQENGVSDCEFVSSFNVEINEEKDYIYDLYSKKKQGTLIINKYYKEKEDDILDESAEFVIYDINNKEVGTYKANNGKIEVKLDYGEYKIVQVKGIDNYNLVEPFNIKITEEKDYVYDLYSEKKQGTLIINKYYKEKEDNIPDESAEFVICDKNNKEVGTYKANNGKIEVKLDFGEYKIVQVKGIDNYNLVEPFNIKITEEKDYIYDLYSEKSIIIENPYTYDASKNILYSFILFFVSLLILLIKLIKTINKKLRK